MAADGLSRVLGSDGYFFGGIIFWNRGTKKNPWSKDISWIWLLFLIKIFTRFVEAVWPFFPWQFELFFQIFNLWRRCKECTFWIIFTTPHVRVFSNDGLFQPLFYVITQLGKNERSLWKKIGIQSWLLDIGLFVCATLLVQNLARGLQGFVNKNTFRPAEKKHRRVN